MDKIITRLYSGSDGESHFEAMKIPLKDFEGLFECSDLIPAKGVIFQEASNNKDHGWHNAPQKQYVITLTGQIEIEVGDGSKRVFSAGDILLAEDSTGRGHITRPNRTMHHSAIVIPLK